MANVTPIDQVVDLAEFGNNPYQLTITPGPGGYPPQPYMTSSPGGTYGINTPVVHASGGGVNCPSVMLHINSCPLCNKLYNPDRTLYILLITILGVVSLVLLKRVMDKN